MHQDNEEQETGLFEAIIVWGIALIAGAYQLIPVMFLAVILYGCHSIGLAPWQ